jgi:hypothetical protein
VGVVTINLEQQTEHRKMSRIANLLSKILCHEVNYGFQFKEDDMECLFIILSQYENVSNSRPGTVLLTSDNKQSKIPAWTASVV